MDNRILSAEQLADYDAYLRIEERTLGTREKYLRDLRAFLAWIQGQPVTKDLVRQWKEALQAQGYAPVTINSKLAALNGLFRFLAWDDCRVRFLKVQRRLFREERRDLSRPEYDRLLKTALAQGKERLALLMRTTGRSIPESASILWRRMENMRFWPPFTAGSARKVKRMCSAIINIPICPTGNALTSTRRRFRRPRSMIPV